MHDGKIAYMVNAGTNNGTRVYLWDGFNNINISGELWAGWLSLDNSSIAFSGYDGDGHELYYWSENSTVKLTDGVCGTPIPSLHNGKIAYLSCGKLYFWDGENHNLIYEDSNVISPVSLHNNKIAFSAYDGNDYEVYFFNGENVLKITDNSVHDKFPSLHDGSIVWSRIYDDDSEIFYWNGVSEYQVTNNNPDQYPDIYDGKIVWNGGSG